MNNPFIFHSYSIISHLCWWNYQYHLHLNGLTTGQLGHILTRWPVADGEALGDQTDSGFWHQDRFSQGRRWPDWGLLLCWPEITSYHASSTQIQAQSSHDIVQITWEISSQITHVNPDPSYSNYKFSSAPSPVASFPPFWHLGELLPEGLLPGRPHAPGRRRGGGESRGAERRVAGWVAGGCWDDYPLVMSK